MERGVCTITIDREPRAVFKAITDITRMGEWSPECVSCEWVAPATSPAVGAKFEGVNRAKLGPITIKKWKTTSEVTKYVENEAFEFVTGDITRWRFEFIEIDGATRLTESFQYEPFSGFSKIMYEKVHDRRQAMVTGIETTLERLKLILEGGAS